MFEYKTCNCIDPLIRCDDRGCLCDYCGGLEPIYVTKSSTDRTVWVDSDGVLADFNERWFQFFDEDAEKMRERMTKKELWNFVKEIDFHFFERLKKLSGSNELIRGIERFGFSPIVLTGSPTYRGYPQKVRWFKEHFPDLPVIVCKSKEKHLFCKPGDILIDDRTKYKHLWEEAGGIFITYTDWRSALNELKQYA